jgi:hypothetical protein
MISACVVASLLLTAGPAPARVWDLGPRHAPLLAATGERGGPGRQRDLHPQDSSGSEAEWIAPTVPAGASTTYRRGLVRRRVAPGVTYTRWRRTEARGPIVAHLLTIDPRTPGLKIDYTSRPKVRQVATVRDLITEDHAVAGVNGDFYDIGYTGAPLGLGKDRQRGLLHARADGWNNAFFIDSHGRAGIDDLPMTATVVHHPELRITNLNSPFVAPGGIGVYTPGWGRTAGYRVTQGQRRHVRAVIVRHGRVVRNRHKLSADKRIRGRLLIGRGGGAASLRALAGGTRIRIHPALHGHPQMAISGNRVLIQDGLIKAVDDRVMAPRTAVGVESETGVILLLVIDGRSTASRGYTMVELANLMAELGADEALNLDGGGSSTMVTENEQRRIAVRNRPADGFERRVSNAIAVSYTDPS